jgi:hypothetical protein
MVEVFTLSTAPGRVFAAVVGGGSLQVYDVSTPSSPERIATLKTPGGRPVRLAVRDHLAYVADGPEGLQVVDLTNPAMPVIVGSFPTRAVARDVAVGDGVVLVATGVGEGNERVLVLRRQP